MHQTGGGNFQRYSKTSNINSLHISFDSSYPQLSQANQLEEITSIESSGDDDVEIVEILWWRKKEKRCRGLQCDQTAKKSFFHQIAFDLSLQ